MRVEYFKYWQGKRKPQKICALNFTHDSTIGSCLLVISAQISMIYSIFVRTYMIPDQAKKTNRQTEDVVVDSSNGRQSETPKTGIQHIFTPSSFK